MNNFFGLPSNVEGRVEYFNNIWKNQVLISKIANIAIDLSDCFTEYQLKRTFKSLEDIAREQDEATEKAIQEARAH